MKDLSDIMRQAQQMQQRLQEAQERMDQLTAEGSSGGGAYCDLGNVLGQFI
jgi:DNA-binding protein YbaB